MTHRRFDPNTLDGVLETELHKMVYRHLDFGPRVEDVPTVHAIMREDLMRHGLTEDDRDRVQKAFWDLGPKIQRFPTPQMIITALPPREGYYRGIEHQPRRNPEQAATAFAKMRKRLGIKPSTEPGQPAFDTTGDDEDDQP